MAVRAIGVDVGGSYVKCGLVEIDTGRILRRHELETPQPSTPEAVARLVAELVSRFPPDLLVGVASPGVIHQGIVERAANLHQGWTNRDAVELMRSAVGRHVVVLNDADAAGTAEIRHGAGRGNDGQVLMLTFGTGIGSALFQGGELVHNTELGHIEMDGRPGEYWAAAAALNRFELSLEQWVHSVNHYIAAVERVLHPELLIVGGGISGSPDGWWDAVRSRTPRVMAHFRGNAGIVGAALAAGKDTLTADSSRQASG